MIHGQYLEPMPLMSSSIRRVFERVEDGVRNLCPDEGIPLDVSELLESCRRELEDEAQQSDAAARVFFDLSLDILCIADQDAHFLRVSPSFERSLGYDPVDVMGKNVMDFVHPDDREATRAASQAARQGRPLKNFENRYMAKSGDVRILRWVYVTSIAGRVYAIARDETERYEQEAALYKTHQILKEAQRIAHVGNWLFDIPTESLTWSAETLRIFGMDPDGPAPTPEAYIELLHPEDRDELLETWYSRRRDGGPPVESTHRIIRPDGTIRFVYERGEVVVDESGKPVQFHGTVVDVTEREVARIRLEQLVRAQSTLLGLSRALLGVDSDAGVGRQVVDWMRQLGDGEWTVSFWIESNSVWHIVETDAPEEVQSLELKVVSRLRKLNRKRLWNVVEKPAIVSVDDFTCIPCPLSDGETACIVIHHPSGELDLDSRVAEALALQVVSTLNNIKAREHVQELTANLFAAEESERRKLARDLHDQAGATLTGLQISLELYRQRLAVSDSTQDDQRHLQVSIDATLDLVSQIRNVAMRLRPSILDDFGVVVAMEWLADSVSQQDGLAVSFSSKIEQDRRFSANVENAVFRVVQESLTNALRHSEAQQVIITLQFQTNELILTVTDDGAGFNPRASSLKRATAGIGGMRERVRLVGGIFQIRSSPGKGTVINARIPAVSMHQPERAS